MRILAFYPYLPFPLDRGAHYRGFYLLRELARAHEVDLLALAEDGAGTEHVGVFQEFCRRVECVPFHHPPWPRLFPRRLLNPLPSTVAHWSLPQVDMTLRRWLAAAHYDAVHVFDIVLGQFLMRCPIPLVFDRTRVDLQYQWMERRHMRGTPKTRWLNLESLAKLWRYERRIARRSRFQIVCGPDDAQFLRKKILPSLDIDVIPNGVDIDYFNPATGSGENRSEYPSILFCGAMDYNPNIDALRWFFSQMFEPLLKQVPQLQMWIVGKDPVPEVKAYAAKPNVRVTGAVPDVRPFYRQAWLQVVPLRIGGGTRLKIVECMAMGTPVISTTIGAQGLHLERERDILLADSAGLFVHETARALLNASLRARVGRAGLDTVHARLAWPVLGRQLIDAYKRRFSDQAMRLDVAGAQTVATGGNKASMAK